MSELVNADTSTDLLNANPFMISVMAFSVLMAFCLDCADAVTHHDTLDLFPVGDH